MPAISGKNFLFSQFIILSNFYQAQMFLKRQRNRQCGKNRLFHVIIVVSAHAVTSHCDGWYEARVGKSAAITILIYSSQIFWLTVSVIIFCVDDTRAWYTLVCRYYQPILTYRRYTGYCLYVLQYVSLVKCIYAWTNDLKWYNYGACPAEDSLLFNN